MLLSEKFENARFTKSVAGYNSKEVDAFVEDIIPALKEQEQNMTTLRAALGAYEAKKEETEAKEREAYRLLEAARDEAKRIIAEAKAEAANVQREAEISAAAEKKVAENAAREQLERAKNTAKACVDEANTSAERIISAADRKGRELLAEAQRGYDEQLLKTRAIAEEYSAFEQRLYTFMASTAEVLNEIKKGTHIFKTVAQTVTAEENSVEVKEPKKDAEATSASPSDVEENTTAEQAQARDYDAFDIVGDTRAVQRPVRKLYDTVTVTYDKDSEFEEIKEIMKNSDGKKLKSPTRFSK